MFFTSIFCGSLFCGSAVHIIKDLIADNCLMSADRGDWVQFCSPFRGSRDPGPSPHSGIFDGPRILYSDIC